MENTHTALSAPSSNLSFERVHRHCWHVLLNGRYVGFIEREVPSLWVGTVCGQPVGKSTLESVKALIRRRLEGGAA